MPFLRATSRYVFFCALLIAPWYYGATTATSIEVVNWLLGTSFLLWVIELLVNRRKPRFPKLLVIIALALLAIGGWMVVNASAIYDPDFGAFAPIATIASHPAGTVDYAISASWMIRGALLLGTIFFVLDLSKSNRAFLHLCYAIGIAAGSIALLGLLQKATDAEMIFWQVPIEKSKEIYPFFASYYYHANAGAFLNLVLPLTTGLALRTFVTPSASGMRALWVTIFALNLAAVAANTSRGAQAVAGLILIGLIIQLGPTLARRMSRAKMNVALAGAAAILILLFAIAQASHLERSSERWAKLSEQMSNNGRLEVAKVAIGVLPHVGPLGFGPGAFRIVFPYFNAQSPHRVTGFWRFLHEDYLQTIIEWGWVGSALWGALLFGGIAVALRSLRRQRQGARSMEQAEEGGGRAANAERPTSNVQRPMAEGEERELEVRGQKIDITSQKSDVRSDERASRGESQNSEPRAPSSQLQPENQEPIAINSPVATGAWSPRRRLILPLVVIALGGVAIHALVDFPFQIYSIQLYVATYLGICWGSACGTGRVNGEWRMVNR